MGGEAAVTAVGATLQAVMDYIAAEAVVLVDNQAQDVDEWKVSVNDATKPFVATVDGSVDEIAKNVLKRCAKFVIVGEEEEGDDDAEELCRCRFSLAYGSKVLLSSIELCLKRGFRYGLPGPYMCGNTTLVRLNARHHCHGLHHPAAPYKAGSSGPYAGDRITCYGHPCGLGQICTSYTHMRAI